MNLAMPRIIYEARAEAPLSPERKGEQRGDECAGERREINVVRKIHRGRSFANESGGEKDKREVSPLNPRLRQAVMGGEMPVKFVLRIHQFGDRKVFKDESASAHAELLA